MSAEPDSAILMDSIGSLDQRQIAAGMCEAVSFLVLAMVRDGLVASETVVASMENLAAYQRTVTAEADQPARMLAATWVHASMIALQSKLATKQ